MMMEDVKILLFTFFTLHWTLCHTIAVCTAIPVIHFFLTLFSRKLVAWLDITDVEFQACQQKKSILCFVKTSVKKDFKYFFDAMCTFRGRKQREKKAAWEPFVLTIAIKSLRSFFIRISFQSHNLKNQTNKLLWGQQPLKV